MNAGDDADAVDWSCCPCVAVHEAIKVDVNVADHGDVVVVDGVVAVDGEATQSWRRKRNAL